MTRDRDAEFHSSETTFACLQETRGARIYLVSSRQDRGEQDESPIAELVARSGADRFICRHIAAGNLSRSAEPLPLDRAIRLALAHSTTTAIADADVQRTIASYREMRDNVIPQLIVGSGLGYSYGFPLTIEGSAPSLVTAIAQSSVFNPAQLSI